MRRIIPITVVTCALIISVLLIHSVLAQTPAPGNPAPAAEEQTPGEVLVKGVSTIPVTFDGHVSKFEYSDATRSTFPNGHGIVDVFTKCCDGFVYFAFQIPDLSPHPGDDIVVMLDTTLGKAAAPAKTDIRAYVRRKMENSRQYQGDGQKWVDCYGDWEYRSAAYSTGWEVEVRYPLKSLNLETGKKTTLGLAFRIWDNQPQKIWNWPVGSDENKPATWGTLVLAPAE